jgi:hypothetical protein
MSAPRDVEQILLRAATAAILDPAQAAWGPSSLRFLTPRGEAAGGRLGEAGDAAESLVMSSATAIWLPATIARAAVPTPAPTGPRHRAPGADDVVDAATATMEAVSTGRHAEPEWSRELFDPRRDGDPFAWLGFADEN